MSAVIWLDQMLVLTFQWSLFVQEAGLCTWVTINLVELSVSGSKDKDLKKDSDV